MDAQINGKRRPEIIASEVLSYEVWVYLAYLFLPIAYISVFVYLRCSKVWEFMLARPKLINLAILS